MLASISTGLKILSFRKGRAGSSPARSTNSTSLLISLCNTKHTSTKALRVLLARAVYTFKWWRFVLGEYARHSIKYLSFRSW